MRKLTFLLTGLVLASTTFGDAIVLKDGTRVEGTIKKVGAQWHVTGSDGKVTKVPEGQVRTIEKGGGSANGPATRPDGSGAAGGAAGAVADANLASLRRSVEVLSDLDLIIERFERFVGNTKDPAIVAEANKDLAIWRDRRDRGLIKQGTNWVTPAEAEALRGRALGTASAARDQLRVGRVAEAESLVQQALGEDPANPAALFLRGVILYRQDKLVDARKAFEEVNKSVQQHAPTLNNLAVILGRQNQHGGALTFYDQAMTAAPVNKFILDNVAEALGTMPEENRKGKAVERVIRRFTEQDTLLQQQLSPQGWFRWGSTWVDQKQLDSLKAAEREVQDRLAALEQEFEENKARVAAIDDQIRSNEQEMRELEARSVWRDRDGRLHRIPLGSAYYDLKRENDNLRSEQTRLQHRFNQLREIAKRTQQQLPTPKFTGVQQLVGVEGTPLLPPLAPPQAGAPTTSPVGG